MERDFVVTDNSISSLMQYVLKDNERENIFNNDWGNIYRFEKTKLWTRIYHKRNEIILLYFVLYDLKFQIILIL